MMGEQERESTSGFSHDVEQGGRRPVALIIGTGLIGGSLGMALGQAGWDVYVRDASPAALALAIELGVGREAAGDDPAPELVLVAAPPDVAAGLVADALRDYPGAFVADVASVKTRILDGVREHATKEQLTRYIGAHPMAGREVSGVISARSDLFQARPFVVVPHDTTASEAVSLLRHIAVDIGSVPVVMGPGDHDTAVAQVSHTPQILSSLLATALLHASEQAMSLSGQGLRDTTRIAGSDPRLWVEILAANADALLPVLAEISQRLSGVREALESLSGTPDPSLGSRKALAQLIADGNRAVARIPGKHGGQGVAYATVAVLVPDQPGELGRLFTDMGEAGINLEDLRLEHALAQRYGIAHISVRAGHESVLIWELRSRGWTVAGE